MSATDFNTLFELLPVAAYRAALDGSLLRVNTAFARLHGYATTQQMLASCGTTPAHGHCYALSTRHPQFMAQLYSGGVHDFDSQVLRWSDQVEIAVREHAQLVRDALGVAMGYEGTVQLQAVEPRLAYNHAQDVAQMQRLEALIAGIPDHVWVIDREGRYVVANQPFLAVNGFKLEDVLGKTTIEVFDDARSVQYQAADQLMMQTLQPTVREDYFVHSTTGAVSYTELAKTPLLNAQGQCIGLAGIARDVTARKLAQETAQLKHAQLMALITSIQDHIWVIDDQGRYQMGNTAFLEAHNLRIDDLLGKTPVDMFGTDRGGLYHVNNAEVMASGKTMVREDVVPNPQSGAPMYLELIKTPL
jgi:PAS domain S-box-containing protein